MAEKDATEGQMKQQRRTNAQDVRRYQAYELVDMEGRAVLNAQAPGIPVVLASAYDAREQAHREEVNGLQAKLAALGKVLGKIGLLARFELSDLNNTEKWKQNFIEIDRLVQDDARRLLDGGKDE